MGTEFLTDMTRLRVFLEGGATRLKPRIDEGSVLITYSGIKSDIKGNTQVKYFMQTWVFKNCYSSLQAVVYFVRSR